MWHCAAGTVHCISSVRNEYKQICGTVQQVQFIAEVVLEMSTNRYVAVCSRILSRKRVLSHSR